MCCVQCAVVSVCVVCSAVNHVISVHCDFVLCVDVVEKFDVSFCVLCV